MCGVIFNHWERGAKDKRQGAAETVPCLRTPREGHIALRLAWGWSGDLLGWLEENRGGPGRAPLQPWRRPQASLYSTVHTPPIVGR